MGNWLGVKSLLKHIYLQPDSQLFGLLVKMSFFEYVSSKVNSEVSLKMNDVVFLMAVSFFLGRWFEQRLTHKPTDYSSEYRYGESEKLPVSSITNCSSNDSHDFSQLENKKTHKEMFGEEEREGLFSKQSEVLLEKIKLQGQKIEQRGTFEMYFEKSATNSKLVRKIEKHEIISDYILDHSLNSNASKKELMPFDTEPDQNSMLEISYMKNYGPYQKPHPLQKRIVKLNERPSGFNRSLLENGRFKKMFRECLKIGQGGFGTVYEGWSIMENRKYAIKKIIIRNSVEKAHQLQRLLTEIQILSSLVHPNIVKYYTCWVEYASIDEENTTANKGQISIDESSHASKQSSRVVYEECMDSNQSEICFEGSSSDIRKSRVRTSSAASENLILKSEKRGFNTLFEQIPAVHIQMELCKGSLATYIRQRTEIDRTFCFWVIRGIFKGVGFLHSNGIVHRDIKPQNIFLSNDEDVIKIGDFGLSLFLGDQNSVKREKVGTPSYMAPEICANSMRSLSKANLYLLDIYSLGVVYYELLSTFSTDHERMSSLNRLKRGKVPGLAKFDLEKRLIKEMVKENRLNIFQIQKSKAYKQLEDFFAEKSPEKQ